MSVSPARFLRAFKSCPKTMTALLFQVLNSMPLTLMRVTVPGNGAAAAAGAGTEGAVGGTGGREDVS